MVYAFVLLLPLGIFLAIGVLLLLRSRPRGPGHPACGKCGYDVSGSVGSVTRCPECGSFFTEVGILPPRPRRKPVVMLTVGALLIVVVVGCLGTSFSFQLAARAEAQRAQSLAARAMATAAQAQSQAATSQAQAAAQQQVVEEQGEAAPAPEPK